MKIGGKLKKIKKVRSAARSSMRSAEPFDPSAIDGDNDGKVQDSTEFERPAVPSASKLQADKGPRMVPRKGPILDRLTPKKRKNKKRVNPPSIPPSEAVGAPRNMQSSDQFGQRLKMPRRMTAREIADVKDSLTGLKLSSEITTRDPKTMPTIYFGAKNWNNNTIALFATVKTDGSPAPYEDSILNKFSPRVREVVDSRPEINYAKLVEKFGPLDTTEDLGKALLQAFPNTSLNGVVVTFPINQSMVAGRLDTPMKTEMLYDEIDPSMALVRYEMLRMLQWGDENPRGASLLTQLNVGNASKDGSAYGSVSNSVERNITNAGAAEEMYDDMNPDTDAVTYQLNMNLQRIMRNYGDPYRIGKTNPQVRAWSVINTHVENEDLSTIEGMLSAVSAIHDHETGHLDWYNVSARGLPGSISDRAFAATRTRSVGAIAAAKKVYEDLGVEEPSVLVKHMLANGLRELAQSVQDLKNRGKGADNVDTRGWMSRATALEESVDPQEIQRLSIDILDDLDSYGIRPGWMFYAPIDGRALYSTNSSTQSWRGTTIPMNTESLQLSDNPFNMPAFTLYRVFEKADIDISLAETKKLLKEAMLFISERSQYGGTSVSEGYAELYAFRSLGYLKESDGAPWRLLQLIEESLVSFGGKSLLHSIGNLRIKVI